MKMTCREWTFLQNHLPDDEAGQALWDKIEQRTWARYGYSPVAIKLTQPEQTLVTKAQELREQRRREALESRA